MSRIKGMKITKIKDDNVGRVIINMSTISAECLERHLNEDPRFEWDSPNRIKNPHHCAMELGKGLKLINQMPQGEVDFDH